ncbi:MULTISPECIES: hypothetical protein [Microcoleaceae]|uniref:hypothetical protein n=1 Tax=Microcoleaceae TaxID=1892252 RepID=UPI0018810930|nr:hypothetical protein [Tychonema sp. LEGE 06208]MBE9160817.1 hypothetical protein [Tychonema sp. LEGE 06208]
MLRISPYPSNLPGQAALYILQYFCFRRDRHQVQTPDIHSEKLAFSAVARSQRSAQNSSN